MIYSLDLTVADVIDRLWRENKHAALARVPQIAEEIENLMHSGYYSEAMRMLKVVYTHPVSNLETALRLLSRSCHECHIEINKDELERQIAWDPNEAREFLWERILEYEPVHLLNCRLFFDDPQPDKVWVRTVAGPVLFRLEWEDDDLDLTFVHISDLLPSLSDLNTNVEQIDSDYLSKHMIVVSLLGRLTLNPKLVQMGLEVMINQYHSRPDIKKYWN